MEFSGDEIQKSWFGIEERPYPLRVSAKLPLGAAQCRIEIGGVSGMEQEQQQGAHFTKPARQRLLRLCKDTKFKLRVNEVRRKWKIPTLAKSSDEANKFWQALCEADRNDPDYHKKYDNGQTKAQQFRQDLEMLCQDPALGLPPDPDMWLVMFHIVMCFDLDNVTEEDILTLPLPPSLARVSIVPKDNRLYLDVTFAAKKDIAEIWGQVEYWQNNIRPYLISEINASPLLKKRQLLPDLLEDIKRGRPSGTKEELALEVARLWYDEGWRDKEFNREFGWKLSPDSYGNLTRCGRARYWAKQGLDLRKKQGIPTTK